MTSLKVNGEARTVAADPETPLLWVLREDLGLTGTKFGCGVGACGACTVHVNGEPVRSAPCLSALQRARISSPSRGWHRAPAWRMVPRTRCNAPGSISKYPSAATASPE